MVSEGQIDALPWIAEGYWVPYVITDYYQVYHGIYTQIYKLIQLQSARWVQELGGSATQFCVSPIL